METPYFWRPFQGQHAIGQEEEDRQNGHKIFAETQPANAVNVEKEVRIRWGLLVRDGQVEDSAPYQGKGHINKGQHRPSQGLKPTIVALGIIEEPI